MPISSAATAEPAFESARLKSLVDFRDENLVRQKYDYSCGAAALATLLQFGLDDRVTERDIIADLFERLSRADTEIRQREGFSLYDLQQVAINRGYKAQGFRLAPQNLPQLQGPVIVFLETMGYKHFAVLKGVRGDRVYLADPSRGNIRMPAYRFLEAWLRDGKGVMLVVEPNDGRGSRTNVLQAPADGLTQPEILGVRELLAVGPLSARKN